MWKWSVCSPKIGEEKFSSMEQCHDSLILTQPKQVQSRREQRVWWNIYNFQAIYQIDMMKKSAASFQFDWRWACLLEDCWRKDIATLAPVWRWKKLSADFVIMWLALDRQYQSQNMAQTRPYVVKWKWSPSSWMDDDMTLVETFEHNELSELSTSYEF